MIDLTIIIPHYNSFKTLENLISSIPIKQNIQTIVIDDYSENYKKWKSIVNSNDFKHILFLENDTNKKGAGVCRNIGLKKAMGEWIIFADADDFFVEHFYERVSKYFHSDCDVVFFKPVSIEIDTGMESDRHRPYEQLIHNYIHRKSIETEIFLRYKFFIPVSKLIRRNFLLEQKILFDEVIASNDVMFSTKLGHYMEKFEVTLAVIYCITRGTGTLMTNTNVKVFNSRLAVHINYCKFIKEKLSKEKYKLLKPNGIGMLFNVFKLKLGLRKFLSVYIELRRNKVTILDSRFINPFFTIRRSMHHYKRYKRQKKYLSDRKI